MDDRNYTVTCAISKNLDNLKGFYTCRGGNPRDGRIIVQYQDDYFLVEISPLTKDKAYNPKDIGDAMGKFGFLLK